MLRGRSSRTTMNGTLDSSITSSAPPAKASELLSCNATGMRSGPQSVARIRRLQAVQIRLHSQRLRELKTQLAGIQEELTAAADYFRDHESRLAANESRLAVSERRLNGHEG